MRTNDNKIICFRTQGEKKFIPINEIVMFCTNERKIDVYTTRGVFDINSTLCSIEDKLVNTSFLRTHQSFLINLNFLHRIKTVGSKSIIEMENIEQTAFLSKGFEEDFYNRIVIL